MYWFEYEFNTPAYIINNIKLISNFGILEYFVLLIIIVIFIFLLYCFIPYVDLLIVYRKKESDKIKRKKLIQSIAIQKDLDDEIEKELDLK